VRKKVGPPRSRFKGEPFRFLFFNAGVEGQYKRNMQIDDLSILATSNDLKNRFTLRMRPHPRERIEDLKYTVNKAGLVVDEWGTGLLWEDLVWCDAAGTSLSTSLLEAAVCGRPCYWINARDDGIFRTDELRKSGLGLLVRSKGEWEKAVIDLFDSRIKPPARIPDDLLYKLKIIPAVSEPWRVRLKI
jgi:hypothetical protein